MLEFMSSEDESLFDYSHAASTYQTSSEPDIVVTGNRTPDGSYWGWGWSFGDGGNQGWGSEQPTPSTEYVEDKAADALATHVANIIKNKPDYNIREYGAVIYRGLDGQIKISEIQPGPIGAQGGQVDLSAIVNQVGAHNVVGFIHSHPDIQPLNGEPNPYAGLLSTGDIEGFSWLDNYGDQSVDQRLYLIHGNQVDEYDVSDNQNAVPDLLNSNTVISETFIL
ncbi:hypothetical protein [Pseudonocardia sp. TMWB2A]|uniref:hypothetical protein n=1 Tax=Pseudonocardia sp. TMWB2A TaxID=687430 RepID=UPI00307FB861